MSDAKRLLTVSIPADVHRELKLTAARQHTTMRELVLSAIELSVLSDSKAAQKQGSGVR